MPNSPVVIDNQTDVSSLEPTSDAKSELTVFVVREILYAGSRALNRDVGLLCAILFSFILNKKSVSWLFAFQVTCLLLLVVWL